MMYLKTYHYIKALALIALVALNYEYWHAEIFGVLIMSAPYLITYTIANKNRYKSRLSHLVRASAGIIVFLLALGLLFGLAEDPQASIGAMFAIVIQYGVILGSEALIALLTSNEDFI